MNERTRNLLLLNMTPERQDRIAQFHAEADAASIREAIAIWEREADTYPNEWKHKEPGDVAEWLAEYARRREAGEPIDMPLRMPDATRLGKLQALHAPFDSDEDDHVVQRCAACIAGYDRHTGELVFASYPCPTIRVLDGEL